MMDTIYTVFGVLLCIMCAACLVIHFLDIKNNNMIKNDEVGYLGSKEQYYHLPIQNRTNYGIGWYIVNAYIIFPIGMALLVFIIFACLYLGLNVFVFPYFTMETISFIVFYILVLAKRKSAFFSILIIHFMIASTICFNVITRLDTIHVILRVLCCMICFAVWVLPNYIYYFRRKSIWLGDTTTSFRHENTNGSETPYMLRNEEYQDFKTETPVRILPAEHEKTIRTNISSSEMEQVRKWKQLYDEGVITEAEYLEKRNQLLGL